MSELMREIEQAKLDLAGMATWFEQEGGISHFVMSKVKMDPETSQCESVPDIETDYDFYAVYVYTKEGTCYCVSDSSTNSASDYMLMRDVRDYLNATLSDTTARKVVKS